MIKKLLSTLALCALAVLPLNAQVPVHGVNASGFAQYAADPATCTPGDVWYNTATNLYKSCPNASVATLGSGGGTTAGADVVRVSSAGVSTLYYASNYSNSPASALLAACGAITDGDFIYIAGETFDFGNNNVGCDLSKGGTITASLVGVGPLSLVKRAYTSATNTPIISPGVNHSRVSNLIITSGVTPGDGNFEIPVFNRLSGGSNYDVLDFGLDNVTINGVTDCIIINPTTASSGYARNYTCNTRWDALVDTAFTNATLTWLMYNTITTCTPDSVNAICTCYRAANGSGSFNLTLMGGNKCTITSALTNGNIRGIDIENNSTNTWQIGAGTWVDTTGVTAGTVYDVANNSLSTLNMVDGVVYNPSRVRNGGGTINYCQDQLSCPPQQLGGIIGASNVGGAVVGLSGLALFSDGATSTHTAMPTDVWLVNPTITTSTTNGMAPLQMEITQLIGAGPARQPWIASVAPGAAAGVYRNTTLPLFPIANGGTVTPIGVNSVPTNGTALGVVRGLTYNIAGTGATVLGAYIGATIPLSSTRYIGFSNSINATETLTQTVMPTAYSISEICAHVGVAQGAGGTLTITLMKNTVATALVITIPASGGSGPWCSTASAVTGAAGDLLDFKLVNADGASASANITALTAADVPTFPATGQFTFGLAASTLTSNQNNYAPPFSGVASTTTQVNAQVGLPRSVRVWNLYCRVTTCPGTNPASVTVQKNGTSGAVTLSIPTSCGAPANFSDTTVGHTMTFAAGDTINIIENQPTSGTAAVIPSCSVEHD